MKRKNTLKTFLMALGLSLCSLTIIAEEPVSQDSDGDLESFFAISLIAGVTESNWVNLDFERVDKTEEFLNINLEMQLRWRGFFYENPGNSQENVDGLFSGDAIGYNFYNNQNWALDIYAVHAFGEAEYVFDWPHPIVDEEGTIIDYNVERLRFPRDDNYRLGLRATGYFKDYLTQFIATPISFEDEIGGFNLSASVRRTWLYKNWNFYGTVGLNYQSSDILNYYYGLSEDESAQIEAHLRAPDSPFKPYKAGDGLLAVGQVGFEYPLSESFVFGGYYTAVLRPNAITDSPVSIEGRLLSTAGLSVTYVF